MMRQILFNALLLLALSLAAPTASFAQNDPRLTPADEIMTTLKTRGYVILENKRTWLGRQRVVAERDGIRRELVFIPATGEILRDYAYREEERGQNTMVASGNQNGDSSDDTTTLTRNTGVTLGSAGVTSSADASPSMSVVESFDIGREGEGNAMADGVSP